MWRDPHKSHRGPYEGDWTAEWHLGWAAWLVLPQVLDERESAAEWPELGGAALALKLCSFPVSQ